MVAISATVIRVRRDLGGEVGVSEAGPESDERCGSKREECRSGDKKRMYGAIEESDEFAAVRNNRLPRWVLNGRLEAARRKGRSRWALTRRGCYAENMETQRMRLERIVDADGCGSRDGVGKIWWRSGCDARAVVWRACCSCLASIFGGVGRQSGRGVDYNVSWPLSGSHGREQPSTQSSTPTGGEAMLMGCISVLDGLSMLVSLHPSRTALI